MIKKILILGRSPFIKKINLKKIDRKIFDILCINQIPNELKNPEYFLAVDDFTEKREFPKKCEVISKETGWQFADYTDFIFENKKKISWSYFSSSAAVSFAIRQGYKKIYLAGVDLIGGDKFEHYDGSFTKNEVKEDICKLEKEFIKNICKKNDVEIYTLNNKNAWIEVADLEKIYTKKIKTLSEYEHQKYFVKWLKENNIKYQSSGNGFVLGGKNKIAYIQKLKASGLSVGYPDIDVFIGKGITLHIEMKKPEKNRISKVQEDWIEWFNKNGYKAKICIGLIEAKNFVIEECRKNNILLEKE